MGKKGSGLLLNQIETTEDAELNFIYHLLFIYLFYFSFVPALQVAAKILGESTQTLKESEFAFCFFVSLVFSAN